MCYSSAFYLAGCAGLVGIGTLSATRVREATAITTAGDRLWCDAEVRQKFDDLNSSDIEGSEGGRRKRHRVGTAGWASTPPGLGSDAQPSQEKHKEG